MYNTALKHKWDNQNVLDYAVKTAKEEERTKAEAEKQQILSDAEAEKQQILLDADLEKRMVILGIALQLKMRGIPTKDIAGMVGLSIKEIEQL